MYKGSNKQNYTAVFFLKHKIYFTFYINYPFVSIYEKKKK